jgi:HlyD family secretion protein
MYAVDLISLPVMSSTSSARCGSDGESSARQRKVMPVGRIWAAVAAVAAALPVLFVFTGASDISSSPVELDLREVSRSTFQLQVEQNGMVEPFRSTEVESACHWTTRILSIIPEGTWVQKGDVVCVLDAADIESYARSREVLLIKYRSRLDNALHEQQMLISRNERKEAAAQHELESAEFDLQEYMEGRYPQDLETMHRNLAMLADDIRATEEELQHTERLWAMGLVSRRARDAQSLAHLKAQQKFDQLEAKHDLLTEFKHPRTQLQLKYRRNDAERNVVRTEIANSLSATKAKLTTLAYERTLRVYERYYRRAMESIEACTLRAPCDGQIVYSNSWRLKSYGISQIEEGARVRLRQKIFEIPDPSRLKVSVPVHESVIYRVQQGMEVSVRLKGFEDDVIRGRVETVSRYPRRRSRYTPDVKDYWLDIELLPNEAQAETLRPRMDAIVQLTLLDLPDVVTIPRDCVVGIAGRNFVWVYDGRELVAREVELGEANSERVCVVSGLQVGEQLAVHMSPQHRASLEETLAGELGLAAR